MLILCILFASYTCTLLSMQGTLTHYKFKGKGNQEIQTYKRTSVQEICDNLGIALNTKPLHEIYSITEEIERPVFNEACNKLHETKSLFMHIAHIPPEIQKNILNYTIDKETTQEEFDAFRGKITRPNKQPLLYKDAIQNLYIYRANTVPFLDFADICFLDGTQYELCKHIHVSSTSLSKVTLTGQQEKILQTIPIALKQKFITNPLFPPKFMCQKPYKDRLWVAFGVGGKLFCNLIRDAYKNKNNYEVDKFTHILTFGFASIWAIGAAIHSFWISKYDLSYEKTIDQI